MESEGEDDRSQVTYCNHASAFLRLLLAGLLFWCVYVCERVRVREVCQRGKEKPSWSKKE